MLENRKVGEDLRRRSLTCLERCDYARFAARGSAKDQMKSLFSQGEEILTSLERALV
jgi:hypothetical protein